MFKKTIVGLMLVLLLVAGCGQDNSNIQNQAQGKPSIKTEQAVQKPRIVGQTKLGKDIVDVEERTRKVKEIDGRIVEIKEYFEAGTNNQIFGFDPNAKPIKSEPLKNEGQKVTKFKSK